MGDTSLWSSFSILEVRLSGPAALPGFSFESCYDTPFTVVFILGTVGDMSLPERISSARCFSFNGTSFVKMTGIGHIRYLPYQKPLYMLHHLISKR